MIEPSETGLGRQLLAAAGITAVGTLAVSAATLSRELAVAYQFGLGRELDAFLVAFLLPSVVVTVFTSSMTSVFVPVYVRTLETKGSIDAERLFSTALLLSIGLLIIVTGLLAAAASVLIDIIASNFDEETKALAVSLSFGLLPVILIGGIANLWAMALNARRLFVASAFTPMLPPFAVCVFVIGLGSVLGPCAIVLGLILGTLIQCGVLVAVSWKNGLKLSVRRAGVTPELTTAMRLYWPALATALFFGGTTVIEQGMAATLEAGSVSAFSYGSKLTTLVLGLSAMALGTAVLPLFSRLLAASEPNKIRATVIRYSRLILLGSIPVTIILYLTSNLVVTLVYQRGAFRPEDSTLVASVLSYHVLQTPFYILAAFGMRLLSALYQHAALMRIAFVGLIVSFLANYFLKSILGVSGIALSSSVMWLVNCALIFRVLDVELGRGLARG